MEKEVEMVHIYYKKDNNTYTGTWENNEYKSKK